MYLFSLISLRPFFQSYRRHIFFFIIFFLLNDPALIIGLAYLISCLSKGKGIATSTVLIHTNCDLLVGTRRTFKDDAAKRYQTLDHSGLFSGAEATRTLEDTTSMILTVAGKGSDTLDKRILIIFIETIDITRTVTPCRHRYHVDSIVRLLYNPRTNHMDLRMY